MTRLTTISFLPLAAVYLGLVVAADLWLTFFLYHGVVCMILPLLALRREGAPLGAVLGLGRRAARRSLVAGTVAGLACAALVLGFFWSLGERLLDGERIRGSLAAWGLTQWKHPAFLAYFVFFNSLVEELFWRGFLWREYKKGLGFWPGTLALSFFFIQYHLLSVGLLFSPATALLFAPFIFAASVGWCLLRHRFGDIYGVAASHLLADVGIILSYVFWA